jgi:regulator of cell morphogenesis and NO signaling
MSTATATAADPGFAARQIGEIAAALPGATAVFRRRKLDFCCGGAVRLADAVAPEALPAIEAELAALAPGAPEAPEETGALIDHIIARYHDVHRSQLPELIRLARRVEAVHRDHPGAPHGLADLLTRIGWEMEDHMVKEEQGLFPMLRTGHGAAMAIGLMRDEHDDHGARLRELEAIAHGHEPPEGACNSWRALLAGTGRFAEDLMQHIHLENNVLFPRFDA